MILLCHNCSTPLFDFPSPHSKTLEAIPCNSLAVDLSARVRDVAELGRSWEKGQGRVKNVVDKLDDVVGQLSEMLSNLKCLQEEYVVASKTLRRKLPYIHLLPLDVLSHIFSFLPKVAREDVAEPAALFRSYANPSTVCKRWRNAVERSAKLWCNLPPINLRTSGEEDLRRVSKFVANSGNLPLTASFTLAGEGSPVPERVMFSEYDDVPEKVEDDGDEDMLDVEEEQNLENPPIQEGFVGLIREIGSRVKRLRLTFSARDIGKLALLEDGGQYQNLESIRINVYTERNRQLVFPPTSPFQHCPKLEHVSLRVSTRHPLVATNIVNLPQLLPWHQISSLHCNYLPLDNLIEILHIAERLKNLDYAPRPGDHRRASTSQRIMGHRGCWRTAVHRGVKSLKMRFDWIEDEEKGAADECLNRLTLPSLEDLTIAGNSTCTLDRLGDFITRSGCEDSLKRFSMRDTPDSDSDLLPILDLLARFTHLSVLHLQTSTQGLEYLLSTLKENSSFLNLRALFVSWQPALDADPSVLDDDIPRGFYPEIESGIRGLIHARTNPEQWQSPEGVTMSSADTDSPCKPLEFFQIHFFHGAAREFLEDLLLKLDKWQGRQVPDEEAVRKEIDTLLREIEVVVQSRVQPNDRLTRKVR